MRIAFFISALLCASAPALAQHACTAPHAPAPVNGAHVSEDQMRAAVAAAKGYIAQADLYQACLTGELDAARTQAGTEGKLLDPVVETGLRTRIAANEKSKRKVESNINNAILVYKKPHPR